MPPSCAAQWVAARLGEGLAGAFEACGPRWPLDGTRVVVLAGVEAGSRIVVEGAELINQVR